MALRICRKTWDQRLRTDKSILIYAQCLRLMYYFQSDMSCEHHVTRATRVALARSSHLHITYPNQHTTQFQKSFTMCSIKPWNSLPLDPSYLMLSFRLDDGTMSGS